MTEVVTAHPAVRAQVHGGACAAGVARCVERAHHGPPARRDGARHLPPQRRFSRLQDTDLFDVIRNEKGFGWEMSRRFATPAQSL